MLAFLVLSEYAIHSIGGGVIGVYDRTKLVHLNRMIYAAKAETEAPSYSDD